ncbi:MAG: hypothetical protein IKN80_05485 [Clostridiales bacterium]|nr:hypothetical protein [Clostridiales bacterium]
MRVRAETRDTEKLHKVINRVVIIFAVYLAVLIAVFACAGIIGAGGNPSKAGIYLTVEGDDKAALLDYMDECGVAVDPEPVIKGRGKFSAVTAAANGLSRYRRK